MPGSLGDDREKPQWNSRSTSTGHKVIPLPSEQAVEKIPMISRLFSRLGLTPGLDQVGRGC
jgi:hypothetical protein